MQRATRLVLAITCTTGLMLGDLPAIAQTPPAATSTDQGPNLTQAQLEQLVAPIALYPDALLTSVLVASTYPLEIVMAERWVTTGTNSKLTGDALTKALAPQDWDPSVKSLVPFPQTLKMMSDQLGWTQNLGNAFLGQQKQVMDAVQSLRQRAMQAGKLNSSAQQKVTVQNASTGAVTYTAPAQPPTQPYTPPPDSAIVIQPANPAVVYVPVYNPTVVYGAWPYPAYPPVYYPPPPGAVAANALVAGMAFGVGVAVTSSLWGWGHCNWGGGTVNVNVNQWNSINRNFTQIHTNNWQFNADHRRGVAYNSAALNNRYAPDRANAHNFNANAYRGYNTPAQNAQRTQNMQQRGDNLQQRNETQQQRTQNAQNRGENQQQRNQNMQQRNSDMQQRQQRAQNRSQQFQSSSWRGMDNGAETQRWSERGHSSLNGMSGGGGFRGGGGRRF